MSEPEEPGSEPADPFPRRVLLLIPVAILLCLSEAQSGEPTTAELETKMFRLVNKDRSEHQKKALRYDQRLAVVARAHSKDMQENGFFSHQSKTTGNVGQRLLTARVKVKVCGENIAKNLSVDLAEKSLMKSPGHRANILGEVYTHCGVGIVRASNGIYYITQVFATPAPEINLKTVGAELAKALNKQRTARGKLPFQVNAILNRLAAEQAAAMARAGRPIAVNISALARAAGLDHKRLSMVHLLTWDPRELAAAEVLHQPRLGRIGFGFTENTRHKKLGYGIIWTVVIFTRD